MPYASNSEAGELLSYAVTSVTPEVARLADRLRPAAPPVRPLSVFYWAASEVDGTWIYRVQMPADELRRLGHDVQAGTRIDAWARDEADIIVGQRVCQTAPTTLWREMARHRRRTGVGPAMVYEVDDDLFNLGPDNPLGELFRHPEVRANMLDCMRLADGITVSTEPLAALARQYNPNVFIVPNAVRPEVFDIPAPARRGKDDGLTLYGWQGSSTHRDDWLEVRDALAEVMRSDPNTRMRFLGTAYPEGLPLDRGRVDGREWTTDIVEHYRRVSRFDVSLAPLKDTVFNRSKSGLRFQESAALGVPTIASDVPAYRSWVRDGQTGILVRDRTGWRAALEELKDPTLRLIMGQRARQQATAWAIPNMIDNWLNAYRALL